MCVLNHTSSAGDVERVLDWLERAPAPAAAAEPPALPHAYDRDPPITRSWPNRRLAGALDTDTLRRLPLLQPLTDAQLERIASLAGQRAVAEAEVVVEQWDATRDFYIVLEGTAVVRTAARRLVDIGPGDFFGELAADQRSGQPRGARPPTRLVTPPGDDPIRAAQVPGRRTGRPVEIQRSAAEEPART